MAQKLILVNTFDSDADDAVPCQIIVNGEVVSVLEPGQMIEWEVASRGIDRDDFTVYVKWHNFWEG